MARRSLDRVVRHIRGLAHQPPGPKWSDAQLLDQYAAQRDEAAFAAIVQRHGQLVRAVCWHVLHQEEDIEDAVQATFLVLARKAVSIRKRVSLASWLHGVALRIALNARKATLRRRAFEKRSANRTPEQPVAEAALHELQALLDKEVQRLPEKFRAPFVLCCLEGLSKGAAARELGWKEGTVSGRVAQARERLRQRLALRGVTLSAVLCATALSADRSSATLSATSMGTVLASAAGKSSQLSAKAATLAESMLHRLWLGQLKWALAPVLLVTVLAVGMGLTFQKPAKIADGQIQPSPTAAGQNRQEEQPRTDRYGDPLPPRALARMGTVRFRHGDKVEVLALSPNGRTLAAASRDETVRLWDVATGKEVRRFPDHKGSLRFIAFSPDGTLLASGVSPSGIVHLSNVTSGKEVRQLQSPVPWLGHVAFSPDGNIVAAAGDRPSHRALGDRHGPSEFAWR